MPEDINDPVYDLTFYYIEGEDGSLPHCYCNKCRDKDGMPLQRKPAPTREDVLSNRVVQAVVQLAPGGGCEVTLLPCSADAYIARRKQELAEENERCEVEEREREKAMAARRRRVTAA
jgi:hypothetical protein